MKIECGKWGVLLLLILCIRAELKAQVKVGPKIGMGLSTFRDTKVSLADGQYNYNGFIYKSTVTFQAGLVMDIKLSNTFSLRPELLFNQRGFKAYSTYYGADMYVNYKISYLEVPVNLVAGGELGPGRLELFAGPAFAVGFGGKGKKEYNGTSSDIDIKSGSQPKQGPSNTVYYNPFNCSMNIGFGYQWKGMLVQLSYNYGFTNVQPHYDDETAESQRKHVITKASAFQFSVGYLIRNRKEISQ
jgi:hypothetical protein